LATRQQSKEIKKYKYLVVNQSKENDTKNHYYLGSTSSHQLQNYQLINNLVHPKK
jgi:hypothetical protein